MTVLPAAGAGAITNTDIDLTVQTANANHKINLRYPKYDFMSKKYLPVSIIQPVNTGFSNGAKC